MHLGSIWEHLRHVKASGKHERGSLAGWLAGWMVGKGDGSKLFIFKRFETDPHGHIAT
jgi:hypothetical protein